MELENNQQFYHESIGDYEISELMTDSAVKQSDSLPEQSEVDQKVPSIIKNLEQTQPKPCTRISQILVSFACDLYEEEMKTIRTLGIIPEQPSQIESRQQFAKKPPDQDDVSTKFTTTDSGETIHKSADHSFSSFPLLPQSQIGQAPMIFKLKKDTNPDKSFSLFRNYLLRNKLQIINDSFNMIVAQLRPKTANNLSMFIESMKSIQDVNLCLCYVPATKSLKIALSSHPKNSSKMNRYHNDLKKHASSLKQYLWEHNCVEVSQAQCIQLTFMKQRQSIKELKRVINSIIKQNYNEIGLQSCLLKILQLRELFMYQLEEKGIKFTKSNALIEIEKKLLAELEFYDLYKNYYSKSEEKYEKRKKVINQKYHLKDLYEYLKISQSERLVDEDDQEDFPYDAAVQQIENFLSDPFPHLFLSNIQRFYNALLLCRQSNTRTSISQQLQTDGELGLVILCLVKSKRKEFYYKIRFIEHYMRVTDNHKYEQMCLNLALGLDYIENSWIVK